MESNSRQKRVTIELSKERMEMKTAGNFLTAGHQDSGYLAFFVDLNVFSYK